VTEVGSSVERDLGSPDPEVRRRATSRVGDLPAALAIPLLVRSLGDGDWRVRKEATQVARALGPSERLLAALVSLLGPGDNVGQRNAAVETLGAFGAHAVPPVVEALASLDADGRKLAAEVLGAAQDPCAMAVLERLTSDSDPNVRMAAVEAVGCLGVQALDHASRVLLRVLADGDLHARLASLDGLNQLGVVVPWEKLEPLVSDPVLQRAALSAASRSSGPEAARALSAALGDAHRSVFRLALIGLAELLLAGELPGRSGSPAGFTLTSDARERVLATLAPGTQDLEMRRAALVVAAAFQEPAAIDVAIDALVDDRLAREADAALGMFGGRALSRLLSRVAHGDAALRAVAIGRLARLDDVEDEPAVRLALRGAIADPSADVVAAALSALGSLGGPEDIAPVFALVADRPRASLASAKAALSAIAMRHPEDGCATARVARHDEGSRVAVATVIGALRGGVLGEIADDVAYLAAILSSPDPETRRTAVVALGDVGSHLGLDAVQFALADEERDVQLAAVRVLGRLRDGAGRPVGAERLVEIAREANDPELTAYAARALGDSGDPSAPAWLEPLVRSRHAVVAVAAVEALQRLACPARLDALLLAAQHPHVEVVKAALCALEDIADPRVGECLGRSLSHPEWNVRRLAADCLGRFGGDGALWVLRDRLADEREALVREAISRALAMIEAPSTVRRPATISPPKAEP
jgi:HEAT repeat protein